MLNQRETAFDPSALFPQDVVDMIEAATGQPLDFGDPLVINKKHYFDANVTVTQPLFTTSAFPALLAAGAISHAGHATENAARAQIRLNVARVYWGALVAREGQKVANEAMELAQKQAEIAASRLTAGTATPQTELQARIAVARAHRDVLAANTRAATANEALARFTGVDADTGLETPITPSIPVSGLADAISAAADRPEIAAADGQARAARLQLASADLTWLPKVDGRFTEAWSQNTGFSGEPNNWMVMVTGSWTLWDGGYRLAEQNKAASNVRLTRANAENQREVVHSDVVSAWEEWHRAQASLESARQERGFAEENVRLSNVGFEAGTVSFVDAQAAAVGLSAARLTELSEEMSADIAARALLVAIGE